MTRISVNYSECDDLEAITKIHYIDIYGESVFYAGSQRGGFPGGNLRKIMAKPAAARHAGELWEIALTVKTRPPGVHDLGVGDKKVNN
ncbi:MAG: hypothetical protein ACRDAJ_02880 [Serratia fonticola]